MKHRKAPREDEIHTFYKKKKNDVGKFPQLFIKYFEERKLSKTWKNATIIFIHERVT